MPHDHKADPLAHLEEILPNSARINLQLEKHPTFVDDAWIANQIGMQIATIRSQRFKRRHGMPHWFTLDAVMIGSSPRYRLTDALDWLASR
jgi:hypothetical protein